MELTKNYYYNTAALSNTAYLLQMYLEQYMANALFRGNSSRIIYASQQYTFRQRLNLLSQNGSESILALQLPYMSYFRQNNFVLDSRPGALNAWAAIEGFEDIGIGYQQLRYMMMTITFNCIAFFTNDIDAQMAVEVLNWIQYPSDKQAIAGSVTYAGTDIQIPVTMNVSNIQFNNGKTERDWLEQQRIIPVQFDFSMRSVILGQEPQGPESNIFFDNSPPVITRKVLLDFLSYKGIDDLFSKSNPDLIVLANYTPDPELIGTLTVTAATNTSIMVVWTYNPLAVPLYQTNVLLALGNNDQFSVPMVQGTYTFTDLESESLYTLYILFFSNAGTVTKYTATASTNNEFIINIPGLIGLKA